MALKDYREAFRWFTQASEQDKTADSALLAGNAALLIPNAKLAVSAARTAVDRDLRNAAARYLLARALQQENQPRLSLEAFTAAASLQPPTGEDLRLVALDYVLLNDYPDALRWLKEAVARQPGNAEAWYSLGRVAFTQGNLPFAEEAFQRALRIDPAMVRAETNLGLTYEAQNRSQDALAAYSRAVAMQQGSSRLSEQPLLNLGKLLIELGRAHEALTPLRQAVEVAPDDAACHEALGRAAAAVEDLPEAELQMKRAVELQAENPRMHYELGRIYRSAGKSELARAEFNMSSKLYGTTSKRDDGEVR